MVSVSYPLPPKDYWVDMDLHLLLALNDQVIKWGWRHRRTCQREVHIIFFTLSFIGGYYDTMRLFTSLLQNISYWRGLLKPKEGLETNFSAC